MRLDEFIDASCQIQDVASLSALFKEALHHFGLDLAMGGYLQQFSPDPVIDTRFMLHYPDDWMSYYINNECLAFDPVRTWALKKTSIFRWSDFPTEELSPPQIALLRNAYEAGLYNGGAVSLHLPHGKILALGFARSTQDKELHKTELHKINALAYQYHVILDDLEHTHQEQPHTITLTSKEKSVIQWCALGKSNSSIADILFISEHAVNFHLRNIYKKLDTNNKTLAVLKAFKAQLIDDLPR